MTYPDLPLEPRAGWFMNFIFPLLIHLSWKWMFDQQRIIVRPFLSPNSLVKGPCTEQELEAMMFVQTYTDVLIPKIRRTFRRKEGLFIQMDFIKGRNLEDVWEEGSLFAAEKEAIVTSITSSIHQIRTLKPPGEFAVGSVTGGPIKDGRISPDSSTSSYRSISEFHDSLRRGVPMDQCAKIFGPEVFAVHKRTNYRSVFSHADICMRNIMLDVNGTPWIIDWELGGWWPEYWEYTKCHFATWKDQPDWLTLMDRHLQSYEKELKSERVLWRPPSRALAED